MSEHLTLADRSWPLLGRLMQVHVLLYRMTGGLVGHHAPGLRPMLLLDHVGARSGKRRTTPLAYMLCEGNLIVAGAKNGHPRNPGWVYNLRAHPHTEVQVGTGKIKVHATEASPAERERLWPVAADYNPAWARYQRRTRRVFPLVILTPERN